MRRFWSSLAILTFGAQLAINAGAQKAPKFPLKQFTLANGLRVVLSEDHSSPVIGLALAYDVGSRNEAKGKTGFAHLFEHLMFEGSLHAPKGAFDKYINGGGGLNNAFTAEEGTIYIESFPAEKLPLVLWLEADRMRSLDVSAGPLKNQQEVVKEEKRLRVDNQPYAGAGIKLQELAYSNFANQHPTIGSMEDLDAASLADVQTFFKTYYAPNNALLVLVGDFNAKTAREYIEKYLGAIPAQHAPPKTDVSEPPQTAERRAIVEDKLARVPAVEIAWHGPSYSNVDTYAADLLMDIVFNGETSRAYQSLVKGQQMALSIRGNLGSKRGPSLFEVTSIHRPNVSSADMERAIYDLIANVQKNPPTESELRRAKTQFRANRYRGFSIFGLESMLGRAIQIAQYAVYYGDPNLVNTEIERYMSVTTSDIKAVAARYLTAENRTVVVVKPAGSQGGSGR